MYDEPRSASRGSVAFLFLVSLAIHAGLLSAAWLGFPARPPEAARDREAARELVWVRVLAPVVADAPEAASAATAPPAAPREPPVAAPPPQRVVRADPAPAPAPAPTPKPVAAEPVPEPAPLHESPPPRAPGAEASREPEPPVAAAPLRRAPRATASLDDLRILRNRRPSYPRAARLRGAEGVTLLRVLVERSGRVGEIEVARSAGDADLDRAARRAIRRWRFAELRAPGAASGLWVLIPVEFRLR